MHQPPIVLIVDDEAYFREIFSEKLNATNFHSDVAEGGSEAIAKAKSLQPDLILMDVKMPHMDGIQTVAKLKEDPATKNIKVVFLTNLGETQDGMQTIDEKFAVSMGAVGFIKKSDDLDLMMRQVESFLQ